MQWARLGSNPPASHCHRSGGELEPNNSGARPKVIYLVLSSLARRFSRNSTDNFISLFIAGVHFSALRLAHRGLVLGWDAPPNQDRSGGIGARLKVRRSRMIGLAPMKAEQQKMLGGKFYDPMDAELVAARARARNLCQALNGTPEAEQETRRNILQELFGKGGESVWMQPPFFCDYGSNIELGERVFFNFNCVVLDVCTVQIGSFTLFGPAVQVYTPMHPLSAELRRREEFGKPVTIGSDVWVGGGAIILPGVNIGDRAVIGAGSVVTRDIPGGVFAAGNPCRVVREISK